MIVVTPGPPPPAEKKTSPLVRVAVGCGAIVLVGLIALAAAGWFARKKVEAVAENPTMTAAELVVRASRDLELVSKDEEAQTLTVRYKKTGEEMTFSAADAKEGRFTFTTKQGTVTIEADGGEDGGTLTVTDDKGQQSVSAGAEAPEDLPDWVPVYPGGTMEGFETVTSPDGRWAAFTMKTPDPADKVSSFYKEKLEGMGFRVETQVAGGPPDGTVIGFGEGDKRTVSVLMSSSEEGTRAAVTYNEQN